MHINTTYRVLPMLAQAQKDGGPRKTTGCGRKRSMASPNVHVASCRRYPFSYQYVEPHLYWNPT